MRARNLSIAFIAITAICLIAAGLIQAAPTVSGRETPSWFLIKSKPEFTIGDPGCATLVAAVATIGATPATLVVPSGSHVISADLTLPATLTLKLLKGAILVTGTTSGSLTATNADTEVALAITCAPNSLVVTGAGTTFRTSYRAGQYITPTNGLCSGTRRLIKEILNDTTLTVFSVFSETDAADATAFSISSNLVSLEGHGLVRGDVIVANGETFYVEKLSGADAFYVHKQPTTAFSGVSWTKGIKVIALGGVQAGRYQINSGTGMLKLGTGSIDAVYPEWYGAVGNTTGITAANANNAAIQKSVFAMTYDGTTEWSTKVKFAPGIYTNNGTINLPGGSYLGGSGVSHSNLYGGTHIVNHYGSTASAYHLFQNIMNRYESSRITFSNLMVSGTLGSTICFSGVAHGNLSTIKDCTFVGGKGTQISVLGTTNNSIITNNTLLQGVNGIRVGNDSQIIGNEIAPNGNNVAGETYYGIMVDGGSNIISNNIIYSDASVAFDGDVIGTYVTDLASSNNIISNNRIDNIDYGIVLAQAGGLVQGNNLYSIRTDGIKMANPIVTGPTGGITMSYPNIRNNYISATGVGLNLGDAYLDNGAITQNQFGPCGAVATVGTVHLSGGASWTYIGDNDGLDRGIGFIAFTADDATPSVLLGTKFKTANANPTTITSFDNGSTGKKITVLINDANTTIDFSSTTLKGNGGVDWTPKSGDVIEATFDGTNWYCLLLIN